MGIDHALGAAGGAAGIAEPRRRILVERAPGDGFAMCREQRLKPPDARPVRPEGVRIRVRPVQDDDMLDRRAPRDHFAGQGQQVGRHRQHAIAGFVDHRGEVRRGQPRVERVAHQPHAHRRIIDLEVMDRVPGECAHPVARLQPQCDQRARQAVAALAERRIAAPPDDRPRIRLHHLAVLEPLGGMIEELVYCQSVGLHETLGHTEGRNGRRRGSPGGRQEDQKVLSSLMPYWRGGPAK